MKKLLSKAILCLALAPFIFSCESDDKDTPFVEPVITTEGVYILNQGNWGGNDADLVYYDVNTKEVTEKIFYNQNKLSLGDLGQDMLIYGSKMYITVTQSNKIFVTDIKGKIIKRTDNSDAIISPVDSENKPMSPHSLVSSNGKVYVSLYGGAVARIDTTSLNIEDKIKVGEYPEKMVVVQNKLFVVNTRTPSDSISVINLNNFTREASIKVVVNPDKIVKDNRDNIYVVSTGDYAKIRPTLQKINPTTKAVTTIGTDIATQITANNDKILLIYKNPDNYPGVAELKYYDVNTNTVVNKSFVSGNVDLTNASVTSIDPTNGNIYISISDYVNKGEMHVFKSNGEYINTIETKGMNPVGAFFLTKTVYE